MRGGEVAGSEPISNVQFYLHKACIAIHKYNIVQTLYPGGNKEMSSILADQ
jgi:hypothetical protein